METRKTIIVDGYKLNLVLGLSKTEYMASFGGSYDDGELWDFPLEELLDGTIDINEEIYYYLINGRCYETTLDA